MSSRKLAEAIEQAGEMLQRVSQGTLRVAEVWTDHCHDEHDKFFECDHELARHWPM